MTAAGNSGNYVDFDEYVGLKLEKTRSTIRSTDMLTALFGVAAMFLGYLLIFVVLDQWVIRDGFSVIWRWILLSTLFLSTIGWLIWKVGVPSMRTVNQLFAAREIENAEPELKSNLLNLVDLKAAGRKINPAILKAMERQAAVRLQDVDITQAIDHKPLVRTLYVLLAIVVVCCVYVLLSPKKVMNSIWRGLLPSSKVQLATRTGILQVKPGDATVAAHQPSVEVQVEIDGETPSHVIMYFSTADGQVDQPIEMYPEQEGQSWYRGQLVGEGGRGLMQDLTYFIKAGDATSPIYKITVEQPPYADIETVGIDFPAYMKLQPVEQRGNGAIDAWEGARIQLIARTNLPVQSAMIQFLDDSEAGRVGEEIVMSVLESGRKLQGLWTLNLRSDGSFPKYYRIHCKTSDARVTTGHVLYPLTIRPDLPPEVALLQPDNDVDVPANATMPLLIQANDPDFELGYLYLNIEKSGQRILRDKISEGRQPRLMFEHDLDIGTLTPAVGDILELWVEAYDNKTPRPNTRNTQKLKIRIVQPVTKKDAEQKLAEQKAQREEKIAQANREDNADQNQQAEQRDGEPNRQREKNARPADESDQKAQQENQQDGDQQQESDQDAEGKRDPNGKGKSGSGRSENGNQRGKKNSENSSNDPSNDQSQSTKPKSDGSDDDEALRKITDHLNQKNDSKKDSQKEKPNSENQDRSKGGNSQQPQQDEEKRGDQNSQDQQPSEQSKAESDKGPDKNNPENQKKQDRNSKNGRSEKNSPNRDQANQNQPEDQTDGSDQSDKPSQDPDQKQSDKQQSADDRSSTTSDGKQKKQGSRKSDEKSKDPADADRDKQNSSDGDDQQQTDSNQGKNKDPQQQNNKQRFKPDSNQDSAEQKKQSGGYQKDPSEDSQGTSPEQGADGKSSDEQKKDGEKTSQNSDKKGASDPSKKESAEKDPNQQSGNDQESDGENQSDKQQRNEPGKGQKKSNGTEKAKPDRDPQKKGEPGKNDNAERDPNEKPETRQRQASDEELKDSENRDPSQKSQDPSKKNSDKGRSNPNDKKNQKSSEDSPPGETADSESGSKEGQDSNRDKPSEGKEGRPSDKSKPSNDNKGRGKTKPDSKDQSPSTDDKKNSEESKPDKNDQPDQPDQTNQKDAKNQDQSDQAGEQKDAAKEKDGSKSKQQSKGKGKDKNGTGKGKGEKSSEGDGEKGDQGGNSSKSGDKPSPKQGNKSNPGGKAGSKNGGESTPDGRDKGQSNNQQGPDGELVDETGDSKAIPAGDDPNLDYTEQATELNLQKLQKDLEQNKVDPELLEKLGWTEAELKHFADRISKSLKEAKTPAETPESQARQMQFKEMLKSLNLQKQGSKRSGAAEPKRDINQIESKRTPPPKTYQSAFEKFTKDINRQKAQPEKPSTKN